MKQQEKSLTADALRTAKQAVHDAVERGTMPVDVAERETARLEELIREQENS